MNKLIIHNNIRKGLVDIWNAQMLLDAELSNHDIPISKKTCNVLPRKLIAFDEARRNYNKTIKTNPEFFIDAFIHFYIDDQKFDGKLSSIWLNPEKVLAIASHFAGVISPDFSTYQDFPTPIKIFNIYRMRSFDYYLEQEGVNCIHNVRWGTEETWEYCFDGIPKNSMIAIGTVASDLRSSNGREVFETGFRKMLETLEPSTIVIYGSSNTKVLEEAKNNGIKVICFPSRAMLVFKGRERHE